MVLYQHRYCSWDHYILDLGLVMKFYQKLMKLGSLAGCHQLPERSFFIRGYQFPFCARCTGICCGYILGGAFFSIYPLHWPVAAIFCYIMFLDWLLQYTHILESTNLWRLITGLFCGYGLINIYLQTIMVVAGIILKIQI